MTRRDFLVKWFSYSLVLVLVALIQGLIFTRIPLWGTIPVLLPVALTALATLEGPVPGAGFGIAVGVLSMYIDGGTAWAILLCCLTGLMVGLLARYVLRQDFVGHMIGALLVLLVRLAACVLPRWTGGLAPLPILLEVGLGELLWTLALAPSVYLLFRFVYRRWGSAYYA